MIKIRQKVLGGDRPVSRFLTLSGASLLSQILPLLFMPVISRLYGSAEFSSPALLASALSVTSTAACLRIDNALMLSKNMEEAAVRFDLAMTICAAFSFALASVCMILAATNIIGGWIAFLPLVTFLSGVTSSCVSFSLVRGNERSAALSNVFRAASYCIFQTVLFPLGGETALILSLVLSYAVGLCPFISVGVFTGGYDKYALTTEMKKLKRFSLYLLPGALAAQAAFSVQSFVLSHISDAAFLGSWWMISRILSAPLGVIASPAGQIFSRELCTADINSRKRVFASFSFVLFVLAVAMSIGLFVLSPLVPVFLGKGWDGADSLIRIALPLFAVRMVTAPVSNTAVMLGKYRAVTFWQISLFVISTVCVIFSYDAMSYLILTQAFLFIAYLGFFFYCRKIAARG